MLDHVAIRVADLAASERFYGTTLGALGIEPTGRDGERVEWRDFQVVAASPGRPPTRNLHVGFVAPSRERVDEFWRAGIDAGYEDDGPPGERPEYTSGYYGAFLRDPDGNSAEAVRHEFVRGGGHVDHLWIRVADLEAEAGFYAATMAHTGLREGRTWERGRQFRGAWATLSLVADGAPPTERLELAFPARDRETVDEFHAAALAAGGEEAAPPAESSHGADGYSASAFTPRRTRVASVFRGGG